MSAVLGIDIGGSGIKANLVDPDDGSLLSQRHRIDTPDPSTPRAVASVVKEMVTHFAYSGPVGCTFPAIIKKGVALSASNVDESWIGEDVDTLFTATTGRPVMVANDADAAGVAEMAFGAGREKDGTVVVLTFGTGIGSAVFHRGVLIPNTEFGHLELRGHSPVESWAAASVRDEEHLSWKVWGKRVDRLLEHIERLLSPDLFILGGGVSREFDRWGKHLRLDVKTVPATLRNEAGIVGVALLASRASHSRDG
ncbi:MAG: polyphosphate--glucose phosphotransferase [Actinomycetota bacterium]